MIAVETLLVALSTYSALPMPQFTWNEKNMRYAICCFPMVGLLCGGSGLCIDLLHFKVFYHVADLHTQHKTQNA